MMAPSKMCAAGVLAVLAAAPLVNAHGYMSVPKTTFAIQGDPTQFCATMDGPTTLTAPSGMSFTTDPASNTKAFTAALKASEYETMRALVDAKAVFASGMSKECGVTSATGAKQPLPDKYVEWAHSSSEGFTPSHQGPCEVWCDDELAFTDDNCAAHFTTAPALLPYDKSKCTGASMLKIYWLALHSSTWQAYINCAPLEGGSGSGSSPAVTPAPASTKTPSTKTPTTTKPAAAATPSPVASDDDEDCEDELPIADSDSGSVGNDNDNDDEDCEDELPVAGDDDEDCEDDLPVAGDDGSEYDDNDGASGATPAPASTTKPATSSAPAATTTAPSTEYDDDEYNTPAPASDDEVGGDADDEVGGDADSGEVGGDADSGEVGGDADDEDCEDELPVAGDDDEDCEDELPIADSDSGSIGGDADDEDCEDELPVAGDDDEDCEEELDVAGEAVRTSDLDFSSLTTGDESEVGTVDAY